MGADVIESQGGSALLVQILNRLGVCVSADTLSWFVQYKVNTCNQYEMKSLKSDTFTVVSADNIDFMQSFACVFCSQKSGSWHGTTVQTAQPLPSLSTADTSHLGDIDTSTEPLHHSGDPPVIGMPSKSLHPSVDSSQVRTLLGHTSGLSMDPYQVVTVTGPPCPPMDPSQVVTVTGPPCPPMDPSQVVTVTGSPCPPMDSS